MKKKDNGVKKLIKKWKESKDEHIRYFGILLERIDYNTKILSEGLSFLFEKSKQFEREFELINKRLDTIEMRLGHLELIVEEHTKILEEHSKMIKNIMKDIEIMKRDIEIMKMDIASLKVEVKKNVTYEEFSALEKRVALLEKLLAEKRK